MPARELLRRKEPAFKDLGFGDREAGDDEVIAAMVRHPALLERPVVERGDRAVLARPVECVHELLD